ncbi:hypothetical protein D3C87_1169720 [compost metagenome]
MLSEGEAWPLQSHDLTQNMQPFIHDRPLQIAVSRRMRSRTGKTAEGIQVPTAQFLDTGKRPKDQAEHIVSNPEQAIRPLDQRLCQLPRAGRGQRRGQRRRPAFALGIPVRARQIGPWLRKHADVRL